MLGDLNATPGGARERFYVILCHHRLPLQAHVVAVRVLVHWYDLTVPDEAEQQPKECKSATCSTGTVPNAKL